MDRVRATGKGNGRMADVLSLGGPLATWIGQWGYLAVFLGILIENAGIPVPGETIIIIATLMATQGVLHVEYLYPAVVLGAVVGGNLGYGVGVMGGRPLLLRTATLWRIKADQIDGVEAQFARHGNWAVFFGRFVMLLRVFAGPIAGMLRMPWPRFFVFNLLGAAAWAALIIVLTYLFGANIRVLLHHLSLTVLVLLAIFALVLGLRQWRRNHV